MSKLITNFGDISLEYTDLKKAQTVLIPVTYDGTSTWGKGANKGPAAILAASANMELYDIETKSEPYKKGIHTVDFFNLPKQPEKMAMTVKNKVNEYSKTGKLIGLLGGEHSVSAGAIFAMAEKYKNLTVLQLDAHSDMRESYENSKYNHACVMARAKEVARLVQVGIRSMDISELKNIKREYIFYAEEIVDDQKWQTKVLKKLTDNVYLTIDLDVFDPAYMPSTGTPEPGGLDWYAVIKLIKLVIKQKTLVGFDVVELCPNKINRAPDFLAAKLIYKILAYYFNK